MFGDYGGYVYHVFIITIIIIIEEYERIVRSKESFIPMEMCAPGRHGSPPFLLSHHMTASYDAS